MRVFKLEWEHDDANGNPDPDKRESHGYFTAVDDAAAERFVYDHHLRTEAMYRGTVRHWVWTEVAPDLLNEDPGDLLRECHQILDCDDLCHLDTRALMGKIEKCLHLLPGYITRTAGGKNG